MLELLQDPAHWAFEIVSEAVFFAIELLVLRRLVQWHDKKKHTKEVSPDD